MSSHFRVWKARLTIANNRVAACITEIVATHSECWQWLWLNCSGLAFAWETWNFTFYLTDCLYCGCFQSRSFKWQGKVLHSLRICLTYILLNINKTLILEKQVHRRNSALSIGCSLLLLAVPRLWRHKYQPCSASFGRFFKWKEGLHFPMVCVTQIFSERS